MCIIHNGTKAFWRADGFKAAINRMQCRKYSEHFLLTMTQHASCAIYCEKIGHIEATNETHADLLAINIKQHSFDRLL